MRRNAPSYPSPFRGSLWNSLFTARPRARPLELSLSRSLRSLAVAATLIVLTISRAHSDERPQIMVIGVAHLEAKDDLHNSTWGSSVFSPDMQRQIGRIIGSLARFNPTRVMIEGRADDPVYVQRYAAYRHREYQLGPDEDDQFGYRLAGSLGLPTIYPIDSTGDFPFDYDSVQAAAVKDHQKSVLVQATAELTGLARRQNRFERASDLIGLMRYLNTREALKGNVGWYLYLDLIGNASGDNAGQSLTSNWYARNLQIFANIARDLRPGDRIIVFIGQGHAAMLRPMIDRAPFLIDVDPEAYLPIR